MNEIIAAQSPQLIEAFSSCPDLETTFTRTLDSVLNNICY